MIGLWRSNTQGNRHDHCDADRISQALYPDRHGKAIAKAGKAGQFQISRPLTVQYCHSRRRRTVTEHATGPPVCCMAAVLFIRLPCRSPWRFVVFLGSPSVLLFYAALITSLPFE
ncbi:uncharacterized protein BO80DRAFT_426906 [Aspergillus ibericus CBS 121593]|uniref:Uncharacterized protein n=1 Tax=Aspergillus ibericus CBS 121593 TaxID=1448316 RepID=A0A395GVR0_9EURO|nr:hypothetical protein BO80DRAFT_426906 [Aspergillus ibericus CBS 121593]RAK99088.1 hypothetical protein BO80DRAFT_426906 [Aspergillus ibericus CBS 121593]